jgi:hypothetical protein
VFKCESEEKDFEDFFSEQTPGHIHIFQLKKKIRLRHSSSWLPTAAARVQTWVWSCGILWWTKVALGQVFSEYFGFPCQSSFHPFLHNHNHLSSGAGTICQ